ncbi:hypothetical protein FGB62_31g129 [Gracilaria domingensis]|nr:hypothetical protein FGB62_31g129 [Gracilaria domingensis]
MVSPAENIVHDIIYGKAGIYSSNDDLKYALDKQIAPSIDHAAGIQRSRLGYVQTTGVVTGFTLPRSTSIVVRAIMNGSVSFEGKLASDIEDETERLLSNYSQSFQDFYRREKESLQARAGGGYFSFFQAAANYGYTDDQITRETLDDAEFRDFRDRASAILASESTSTLSADFSVEIEGRSEGYRETITVFGYVYFNQMTLSSERRRSRPRDDYSGEGEY